MHTYLKLLFRGIFKRKLTTSISLFGFSIALTLIMFIALFLKNELTNDSFHKNFSQIYRVDSEYKTNIYPLTAAPMADWLSDNFSEVKQSARMFSPYFKSLYYVKKDNISYEIENPVFVDPSFFDVFSFPIKAGTISEDFDTKNAIVLTEPLAKKLFGNDNPIGKTLQYSGKDGFTVVAVLESLPSNSTMHFDLLLPFASFNDFNTFSLEDWGRLTYQTFVITDQEPLAFESQINLKMKDQFPDKEFKYLVSPLKDIHFSPNAEYDNIFRHESRTSLHLFMAIAIAILLIAVINFLNLTLASSSLRTKELKIRQIEGANRVQLSMQYIIEAVLISLMASFVAIAFIEVLFPSFNNVLESPLATSQIREPWFYLIIFSISIVTGILSGIYPALKFSKTNNISLNNKSGTSAFSSKWNSILLVFQFAASIILVISTLVIIKQSNYIQNCQLGFNKEHVLYLRLDDNLIQHKQTILDKLENLPEIISATTCDFIPGQAYSQQLLSVNVNGEEKTLSVFRTMVSNHYLKTLDIKTTDGHAFYKNKETDPTNIMVNEAFVKAFDLPTPVGTVIDNETIIGVVNDFNFNSLHQSVGPMIIRLRDDSQTSMMMRVNTVDLKEMASLIPNIKNTISEIVPNTFIDIKFLNEKIGQQYKKETKTRKLLSYFSFFAIFISIMGLFGLVIFITNRRIKEIGIRKINGAKISEVIVMLNKSILVWVVIAFIIALPFAWYAMHKWLENYAYKTDLNWWIFAFAGVLTMGIALITVSWQSWKAATKNPIDSLRYE